MPVVLSALAAIIPMVCYMTLIWYMDKYDREPYRLVLMNFVWGAIGAVVFGVAGSALFAQGFEFFVKSYGSDGFFGAVITAPLVEEFTKGLFLIITVQSSRFDSITDGLVYGGAIGLGFGMTENFLYFIAFGGSLPDWMLLVTIRTIFPAVMHCVSTGILGLFAAMTKFSKPGFRLFYISTGYCIAVLIHFMWNLLVSFSSSFLYGFLFILFAALSFIIIFQFSISRERKIIVRELSEETASDLFPHEHIGIIVSQRRNYPGWIDEKVRKSYVQALITLALRKNQLKTARGRYRDLYLYEIEYYRLYIKNLLTEAV